jgi:hypothetical protein
MESRMHRSLRWLLPLSLVAVVAACNKPAADSPAPAPAAADAAASTPGDADAATTSASSADTGFVLTMDKVDAYYATIGKLSGMAAAAGDGGNEDMDDVTAMNGSESIDEYIARIEADPKARAMITSAGMSVSDYAHTNEALMSGIMTAGALESGALKQIPDGIDPQYVKIAQEHKAELAARLEALQKQYGG